MRPDRDQRLRNALEIGAPAVSLAAIHRRADASAARQRLQQFMFGTVAAVVLILSISGTRAPMGSATQAIPFADPRIPTPLASASPYGGVENTKVNKVGNPVPAPTPAPAPMIT